MKSPFIFFNRYLSGLNPGDSLDHKFPLRGESPFGKGDIEISEDGSFHCKASKAKGDAVEFLKERYPLLTESGAEKAIAIESEDQPELGQLEVESRIKTFRADEAALAQVSESTGITTSMLKEIPAWAELDGVTLNMVHYSDLSKPVCVTSWEQGDRHETLYGVPRLTDKPTAPRIWFVENPLDAQALQVAIGEPVYVRPSRDSLQWNDYEKLTHGKQVVLLIQKESGDWEYSAYPFIEKLKQWNCNSRVLYKEPLTKGIPLIQWVGTAENKDVLLATGKEEEPALYDEKTYHDFIGREGVKSLYAPQDVQGGTFWYKVDDGDFVHSNPVNVLSEEELLDDHQLEADGEVEEGIRLSRQQILNIMASSSQLSPASTYEHIKQFISEYIYLDHKEMASLITLWIMGGYVYRLFSAYSYIHLNGVRDTGKTTLMDLITLIGFNGVTQSQSTRGQRDRPSG